MIIVYSHIQYIQTEPKIIVKIHNIAKKLLQNGEKNSIIEVCMKRRSINGK